ncbi:MAG: protein kinase [Planctomycetota bacterium]
MSDARIGQNLGKYTLTEKIGRGGMAEVFKAYQENLDRYVAVKIMHPFLVEMEGENFLNRFRREAKSVAALRHPNVVQVFDFGVEDDAAYMVMEYLEGGDLKDELKALSKRGETMPLAEAQRIFQAVAKAVDYAYSQGMAHRDLKPDNVMLTAKGDVVLTDFGIAKIVGGTQYTAAGAVMGTPAYMSPEQALGDVDRLDERSDVFSLGCLLVEILTGSPPYTGRTAEEVLMKAARHEIAMAEERLRESGADRRLVDLALLCMKKERKKRPRNARILAKAVTAYLSSVEKRLRNAQIVATKAMAQARGERKARRLTTVLAAAVLLVAMVGGGGFLWMNGKRIAAAEEHSRRVGRAFEDAGQLASVARRSGSVRRWAEAEETAAIARSLAGDGEIDEDRVRRIDELHASIAAEAAAARQIASRGKANRELLEEVGKIRTGGSDATGHAGLAAAYHGAFERAGFDVDAMETMEIVERIRENDLAAELAPVFDSWAVSRQRANPDARGEWMKLSAVAREVDPNEWRNRFRDAWCSGGSGEILALAGSVRIEDLDAYSLSLLGNALGQQDERLRAIDVLERAATRHPDDFWLHAWLGYWLCRERRWKEAVCEYTAALAIQPRSAGTWNNLAWALGETGQAEEELAALRRAIGIDPGFARALYNQGIALSETGETERAISVLERAVAVRPDYALAWRALGTLHLELGDVRRAVEAIGKATRLKAESKAEQVESLKRLGRVYLQQENYPSAERYLGRAVTIDPEDPEAHTLHGKAYWGLGKRDEAEVSWLSAIRVDPDYDYARRSLIDAYGIRDSLPKHIEKWLADVDDDPNDWQAWFNLGLAREEDEDWPEAIEAFVRARDLHPESGWTHYALANVLRHVHAYEEAREAYLQAAKLIPGNPGIQNDLGATYQRLGRPDLAIHAYRTALHENPDEVFSLFNLGNVLINYGHTQSGLDELAKALEIEPTYKDALTRYVSTLCWRRAEGDVGRAIAAAVRALESDKEDPNGAYQLGTALGYRKSIEVARGRQKRHLADADEVMLAGYWNNFGLARFRCGDAKTAVTAWKIARDTYPEGSLAVRNLPLGLRALGDREGALAECVDMLKRNPESKMAREAMARTIQALGDRDAAVDAWEEVFARDPTIAAAREYLVAALYRRGTDTDLEKAVGVVLEAARAAPADPNVQLSLGRALGWIGDADRALNLHGKEFPDATVTSEALFRRGFAWGLFDRRRLEESLGFAVEAAGMQPLNPQHHGMVAAAIAYRLPYGDAVEKYHDLFPERSQAHEVYFYRSLANNYHWLQEFENALTANEEFRKRLPVNSQMRPGALYRASTILRSLHRHEEAMARVKKMARLIPGNFWPDRAMAEILMDLGRYREAANLLFSAKEAYQGAPLPNYWLGVVMLRLGDFEAACDQLQRGRLMTGYIERGGWWLDQATRMSELAPRRAAILTGTAKPESAQDAIDFARFATYSGYPLQSVAWYEQAFEREPELLDDLLEGHRFAAVEAALLAAAGKGAIAETLGEKRRAAWRARALSWMKQELAAWRQFLVDDYYGFAAEVVRPWHARAGFPSGWRIEPAFAIVAHPDLAAQLPPEEKAEWDAIFEGARQLIREYAKLENRE